MLLSYKMKLSPFFLPFVYAANEISIRSGRFKVFVVE